MMASHRFAVGDKVRLKSLYGMPANTAETYRVMRTMPSESGPPQYRIRSDEERHERVAAEDNLARSTG